MSLPDDAEIQRRMARIEGLIEAIEAGDDGPLRDAARELAAAVIGFHGAGLARIFDRLAEAGAPGRAVAEACARDDLVAALLSLHDLLPRADPDLVQLRLGRDTPAAAPPTPAPDLTFEPAGASLVRDAAAPLIALAVRIQSRVPDQSVQAILLRCQVRIEPQRRGYGAREQEALGALFGDPRDYHRTLRPVLWAHTGAAVPAFTGETVVEMALPFTHDLAVAPDRYLVAIEEGEVPLLLLFSGTVFWAREDGALRAEPIAWTHEARTALPVKVFREALDLHYPETVPLLIRRDTFERLRRHRIDGRHTSWEETVESLLPPGPGGGVILPERVRAVADALLYEGYALYPYRTSSPKNRHRFLIGTLSPRAVAEVSGDPWRLRCACLLEADEGAEIEAVARFLRFEAHNQAVPEEVPAGPVRAGELATRSLRRPFAMPGVEGEIGLSAEPIDGVVLRIVVTVDNLTPLDADASPDRVQRAGLASAHAILGVRGGAFVSLLDPPPHLAEAAERCRNAGAWPALAGAPGDRDLVLCSPIIVGDHPRVAPESPGDLFDGTEIDELLTLRILTMTDAEKREAAAEDPRVRALIERTEGLQPEQIARMHGAIRGPRTARVRGREIRPGDRVRLHPRGRGDIMDLALAGEEATVTSIEEDYEDRTFVAVTVDADPGRDFGARGLPGHRFFFRTDEVEPI